MPKHWWKTFFEEDFARLFLVRHPREVTQTVRFLMKHLHLKKDDLLFDQCSGIGTISHALAEQGYRTIGIEQSRRYVQEAQKTAKKEQLKNCLFISGDALRFLPSETADGAFNWYTSFGYYLDDEQNLQMLKQAFASLKKGKWFALDFHNSFYLLRGRLPVRTYIKKINKQTIRVKRHSWVNLEHGTLTSEWTYSFPGEPDRVRAGTTRLYMPAELKQMFLQAGFRDLRFFGGTDEQPLSLKSPRCIIVGRKPL